MKEACTSLSASQPGAKSSSTADYSALGWWSSSAHGECLGEYCKIAVVSEAQFSDFVFLEPRDGIVFVQRDIDRSSRPTFDQPDLHVESVGVDLLHGRACRCRDLDPELLVQFPSKRHAGKLSRFHMSTG